MQIDDVLRQMGGLQSMARELGVSEAEAAKGAAALLPSILGGFKKQAQSQPTGLEGLGGLLGKLGGGSLLDEVLSPDPTNVDRGNDVLGQIFGSKEVSREVAKDASPRAGLDPTILKKMLPILAMMVAGYMAKQRAAAKPSAGATESRGGSLGDILGNLAGGQANAGSLGGAIGGLGGLAAMFDSDGDGNPLDDILRRVGKAR